MRARKLFDSGSKWADITARAAMPIVLRRAIDGEPITYGDLDKALVSRGGLTVMAIAYKYVAGKIGDICEELSKDLAESVPPLNAIIVNQQSGLPSDGVDGYLARYFGKTPSYIKELSDLQRDAYAAQAMETVLAYNGWDKVRKHLGIPLKDLDLDHRDRGDPIPPPNPKRFATGPESEAHKTLKAWVADNPSVFVSYGKFEKGGTEKGLSSGDRLDVLFDNGNEMLAVEVKAQSASDDEVQRGVYQCIKYRATLRAMQLAAAKPPNGNAVLVLDRRPPTIAADLASRLSVNILTISIDR